MKHTENSVTRGKTPFRNLNAFVVCFLEVALLLLVFNGTPSTSFMFKDLYIPGTLLTVSPACEELTSAMCSLILAEYRHTMLQCIADGGVLQEKGLGQASGTIIEQGASLALPSCSDTLKTVYNW